MKRRDENNAICLIPSRLDSKRFPNKALHKIDGIPLVKRVYQSALYNQYLPNLATRYCFTKIAVVSSDKAILKLFPHSHIKTKGNFNNGTERICAAIKTLNVHDNDIIVNVQGDIPYFPSIIIQRLLQSFNSHDCDIATLGSPLLYNEAYNTNVVKVGLFKKEIMFSRNAWAAKLYKHIGIYAYKVRALKKYEQWGQSTLEQLENLEQLRFVTNKEPIYLVKTPHMVASVDCKEDLLIADI